LMWAHYANQFEGICIAYDFFKLRGVLSDQVSFSRIYYNEELPQLSNSKQPIDLVQKAKMILSYKNHRWMYEREWRMFADVGKVHFDSPRCIARVYVGSRVHQNRRRDIVRRLGLMKIPLKLQKLDGYGMTFQRLS
jgi:hypothetical protein